MPRLQYDKAKMLADWKATTCTVRDLASKYRVSHTTAHNVVRGVPKDLCVLVDKQVEIKQELANFNGHEVDKFQEEVERRCKGLELVTNATHANLGRMMGKFDKGSADYQQEMSVMDHKLVQSTIKDARESLLGKEPQQAAASNYNNQINIGFSSRDWLEGKVNKLNGTTN